MTTQKLAATSVHKHLYEATAALFILAIPHAVVVFAVDLSPALLNLHLIMIVLAGFVGWRAEVGVTYSQAAKKGRKKATIHATTQRKYSAEIDDLERRLRESDF